MDDIIARIKQKLAYLQEHNDSGNLVEDLGGVGLHSFYAVYGAHTEAEIAAFEARHQIRLPDDYRRFINEIGSEGYNPGCTMYSPLIRMVTEEELNNFFHRMNDLEAEVDEGEFWKDGAPILGILRHPFPFYEAPTYEDVESLENALRDPTAWWQGYGHLRIVDEGIECGYILIVTGVAHGQIWYRNGNSFTPVFTIDRELYGSRANHTIPPNAQRVTFTQWYETWLDQQVRIKQEHWQKRGRDIPPLTLE